MRRNLPQTNLLLLPFAWVYGLAVWCRNFMFDTGLLPSHSFPVPVISVGNITVGGTGKTPHVEYILSLISRHVNAAVLSRGYRRKTRNFRIVKTHSPVREVGDEPLQIKQKFPETRVAVDRKRVRGIKKLLEEAGGPLTILLDDAYQHRYVKPNLNILLIDYNRPLNRDYLLPRGRLREQARAKARADIIVVSKCPEKMNTVDRNLLISEIGAETRQPVFFSSLHHLEPVPVFPDEAPAMETATLRQKNCGILLVTGIANNRPLKNFLHGLNPRISELRFPDHHTFSGTDIAKISRVFGEMEQENKLIVTTSKDAVRLRETPLPDTLRKVMYEVRVEVVFLFGEAALFNEKILNHVGKN